MSTIENVLTSSGWKKARREAKEQARIQEESLRRQKQREKLELAEAENELAMKTSMANSPLKGRRSLIRPLMNGLKDRLG